MTESIHSGVEERALALLGAGIGVESVASALGVTPSRISQLLSDSDFAAAVTQIKFETMSAHTERDGKYDSVEDSLLKKLETSLPLLLRPSDILGAIKVINGAKRRGQDSQEALVDRKNIVQLTMPVAIMQQFTTNIDNMVVGVGEKELRTISSGDLRSSCSIPESSEPAALTDETTEVEQAPNVLEEDTLLASL